MVGNRERRGESPIRFLSDLAESRNSDELENAAAALASSSLRAALDTASIPANAWAADDLRLRRRREDLRAGAEERPGPMHAFAPDRSQPAADEARRRRREPGIANTAGGVRHTRPRRCGHERRYAADAHPARGPGGGAAGQGAGRRGWPGRATVRRWHVRRHPAGLRAPPALPAGAAGARPCCRSSSRNAAGAAVASLPRIPAASRRASCSPHHGPRRHAGHPHTRPAIRAGAANLRRQAATDNVAPDRDAAAPPMR